MHTHAGISFKNNNNNIDVSTILISGNIYIVETDLPELEDVANIAYMLLQSY